MRHFTARRSHLLLDRLALERAWLGATDAGLLAVLVVSVGKVGNPAGGSCCCVCADACRGCSTACVQRRASPPPFGALHSPQVTGTRLWATPTPQGRLNGATQPALWHKSSAAAAASPHSCQQARLLPGARTWYPRRVPAQPVARLYPSLCVSMSLPSALLLPVHCGPPSSRLFSACRTSASCLSCLPAYLPACSSRLGIFVQRWLAAR